MRQIKLQASKYVAKLIKGFRKCHISLHILKLFLSDDQIIQEIFRGQNRI